MRTVAIAFGCLGAVLAAPTLAQAQHAGGRLRGTVSDSLRQQLAGARVQVPALSILTSTGRDGRFELPSIPVGSYRLVVAYIGFEPDTEDVTVRAGQATALAVVLSPLPTVLPSITVSSARSRGDAMALNQQRTSDQIVNVVPAEVITSRARLSTRLGVTHNGASIFEYNFHDVAADGTVDPTLSPGGPTGPNGDVYLYSRTQLDVQVGYRLPDGIEIYANGLNLNNAVFGFYNGNPRNTIQREFYGPSTSLGVRVNR